MSASVFQRSGNDLIMEEFSKNVAGAPEISADQRSVMVGRDIYVNILNKYIQGRVVLVLVRMLSGIDAPERFGGVLANGISC